jgi:hypothetical protein
VLSGVEWVEVAAATGSQNLFLGVKILYRKAIGIKFNRTGVVFGKFANRYEVFDNRRSM